VIPLIVKVTVLNMSVAWPNVPLAAGIEGISRSTVGWSSRSSLKAPRVRPAGEVSDAKETGVQRVLASL